MGEGNDPAGSGQNRIVEKLATQAPTKLLGPSLAMIAITYQSLTYSATDIFYRVFQVAPEEVGFSYTEILGRNSLKLVVLVLIWAAAVSAVALFGGVWLLVGSKIAGPGAFASSGSTVHWLRRHYSRWFGRLAALLLLLIALGVAIFHAQPLLDATGIRESARKVHSGQGLPPELSLNPLRLAVPRADLVSVRWIGVGPAPPSVPGLADTNEGASLIYFGQSGGQSVFFDPLRKSVLRLPSATILVAGPPLR